MKPANQSPFLCCGSRNGSVQISSSQPLECKEAEPRVFNCNSTVESVWVKVLDKEILQGILAPCAYLFKDKYVDVA